MDTALDFNDAVAAELRRQRAARGLTIDQVARRAGMVRTTVLRYLNGKRAIPIGALYGLSAALCVEAHRVVATAEAACAVHSATTGVPSGDTRPDFGEAAPQVSLFPRSQTRRTLPPHGHTEIAPPLTA